MAYFLILIPAFLLLTGCASTDTTAEHNKCLAENSATPDKCEKPTRTPSQIDRPMRFNRHSY